VIGATQIRRRLVSPSFAEFGCFIQRRLWVRDYVCMHACMHLSMLACLGHAPLLASLSHVDLEGPCSPCSSARTTGSFPSRQAAAPSACTLLTSRCGTAWAWRARAHLHSMRSALCGACASAYIHTCTELARRRERACPASQSAPDTPKPVGGMDVRCNLTRSCAAVPTDKSALAHATTLPGDGMRDGHP